MSSLEKIKEQVNAVQVQFDLFDRFSVEIEKTESEITALENTGDTLQTFEKFQEVNAKKNYLQQLKKQRDEWEKNNILKIASQLRSINVSMFLHGEITNNEELKTQRNNIKEKALELVGLIATYNDNYKGMVNDLAEEVGNTGYSKLVSRVNASDVYNEQSYNYLPDDTIVLLESRSALLDEKDGLDELAKRLTNGY